MVSGTREARGGTLVLGGGFAGSYVARRLGSRGATIVNPDNFMLYTPLLPEAAAGSVEARHVTVPLRAMCRARGPAARPGGRARPRGPPRARRLRGGAVRRRVHRPRRRARRRHAHARGPRAARARARAQGPLRRDPAAQPRPAPDRSRRRRALDGAAAAHVRVRRRRLRGRRGARRAAGARRWRSCATRGSPACAPRWILVDPGERILGQTPERLAAFAERLLARRGVETHWACGSPRSKPAARCSPTGAGSTPRPSSGPRAWPPTRSSRELGLPTDERGRVVVDETLRVAGMPGVWALGDCAAVPNAATPGELDPATCQHALRQARRLARNLRGAPQPVPLPHAREDGHARHAPRHRRGRATCACAGCPAGWSPAATT